MNKKRTTIFILLVMFFVFPFAVHAKKTVADAPGFLQTASQRAGVEQTNVQTMIGTIIKSALTITGLIFLILMVYGGFLWMTGRGEEEQISKAKKTISAAVIGIIIVAGSYAITVFVTERVVEGQTSQGSGSFEQPDNAPFEGCCIDRTGQLTWAARITTLDECQSNEGTDNYSGGRGDGWEFYGVSEWTACSEIFSCWDGGRDNDCLNLIGATPY